MKAKNKTRLVEGSILTAYLTFVFVIFGLPGCTFFGSKEGKQRSAVTANQNQIDEEVRANNTGAVDALQVAPTNAATVLAKRLTMKNQQLIGLPLKRLPVDEALSGMAEAIDSIDQRLDLQDHLIQERDEYKRKYEETRDQLVDMGKKYEAERNKSILSRIWHWTMATLGLTGLIALGILCPAIIPIVGKILAWIIGRVPMLGSYFGMVGRDAFKSVVNAVSDIRTELKNSPDPTMLKAADKILKTHTEENSYHRPLIDAMRPIRISAPQI